MIDITDLFHTIRNLHIAQELGLLADSRASEALLPLALHPPAYLTGWGVAAQCQRECAYALAQLGTEASRQALQVLVQSADLGLQAFGEEGLAHWAVVVQ